ncbi:MAG TPA: hypothetical protein VJ970_00790 [Flavobacteriaceae bacterium]|nr:hypothetical protein [Flavobacteriaceae bacterium]
MLRWIVVTAVILAVDIYAFQAVKTVTKNPIFHIIYWAFSLIVIVNFIYQLATYGRYKGLSPSVMLAFGLLILSGSLKLIPFFILLGEDIFRLGSTVVSYFITNTEPPFMPERRDVVSKIALAIAAIPFTSVLYGMIKGKYNYQVIKHTLFFDDLPDNFDGFTLTQISDVHSGSFDNAEKIDYGIDLINEQNSDVILFTN